MVKPVPDEAHTITPHLVIKGAAEAIEFYKRAFGAIELARMPFPGPDGTIRIGHAELKFGESKVMVADEFPEQGYLGPAGIPPVTIHMYVPDTDATFARAVEAGASVTMPPADMFWGDRYAKLVDPFGHHWSLATHIEDVTVEQMTERVAAMFGGDKSCGAPAEEEAVSAA